MADLNSIVSYFKGLQDRICAELESWDGKARFEEDAWERPGGGGGRSRVIRGGKIFEKGGVNFSHVHGKLPEKISSRLGLTEGVEFHATGVSLVLHPEKPTQPISHMNVRYFETSDGGHWFGGGMDVTPIYVDVAQARQFHQGLKELCDAHSPEYYPQFKAACDRYFYLPHREETRGIGGLFYDFLKAPNPEEKEKLFAFHRAVGDHFVEAYRPFIHDNQDKAFGRREKDFQMLRRSRYVEFNLIYDKGTKFGLDTGGRTESILMSMPPRAEWAYNYQPEPGSPEERTLQLLRPLDWLSQEAIAQ